MDIPNLTLEQLQTYEMGHDLIQNILPHLTVDEREFLLTGLVGDEWEELWKEGKGEAERQLDAASDDDAAF